MTTSLLITCLFTACFCMVAKRLSTTVLTAPMLFIAFGLIMSHAGLFPLGEMEETLHLVAEIALVILLFLDAAKTDIAALRVRFVWPARMLLIGLPLSIVFGSIAAWLLLPTWPLVAVVLVAAIFAPTDAALGQAVVSNPIVPDRVRRALTVESGLNDGLALPVILLFASLTANAVDAGDTNWLLFGAKQLVLGPLVGAAVGLMGGVVLLWAKDREFTADVYEGVGAIAMALAAYLGATAIGGNGFIAAFIAGLCFGGIVKDGCKFIFEFTESEGQGLTWGAFFLLGLVLVPDAIAHLSWSTLAIILVSLFIVRPLAIWLSLMGTDASPLTRIFFGWFGPRGLATALFALMVVGEIDSEFAEPILHLAVNAVWISALLHGLTAVPGANWYAARVKALGKCAETNPDH
ncbi:MAG: cation:proton antiporter [Hyphomicrobiales bacterium]